MKDVKQAVYNFMCGCDLPCLDEPQMVLKAIKHWEDWLKRSQIPTTDRRRFYLQSLRLKITMPHLFTRDKGMKTIKRKPWHRKTDKWQVQATDGSFIASAVRPRWSAGYWEWAIPDNTDKYLVNREPWSTPPPQITANQSRLSRRRIV